MRKALCIKEGKEQSQIETKRSIQSNCKEERTKYSMAVEIKFKGGERVGRSREFEYSITPRVEILFKSVCTTRIWRDI